MLYLVATPIGNMEDITLRVIRILKEVDTILAEDTRQTRKILSRHDIHTPLSSFHDHTSKKKLKEIIGQLKAGNTMAFCTDAGTPLVSDPGYNLVRECIREGLEVSSLPGPSALTAGLPLAGLPMARFAFEGFLSPRPSRRLRELRALGAEPRTLVFYESPHRLLKTLGDIHNIMGDRLIAVMKELTKKFETVYRGEVSKVIEAVQEEPVRGEYMIVLEGNPEGKFDTGVLRDVMGRLSKKQ